MIVRARRVGRRARTAMGFSAGRLSSDEQDDEDDPKDRAESAADIGAADVEAAAAKHDHKNDDQEYQVHELRPSNKQCAGTNYRKPGRRDQITVAMNRSQSRQRNHAIPSVIANRTSSLVRVTPSLALIWLHAFATVL